MFFDYFKLLFHDHTTCYIESPVPAQGALQFCKILPDIKKNEFKSEKIEIMTEKVPFFSHS